MEMFEGTDPTVWVFVGLLVVTAFALGLLVDAGSGVIYLYRWHRRRVERKATPAERLAAVAQAVDSPAYGRAPAVDPEPTVPIAGSDVPHRVGFVLADPGVPPRVQSGTAQDPELLATLRAGQELSAVVLEEVRRPSTLADVPDPYDSGDRFDIYPATDDPPRDEQRIVPDNRREAGRDDDPPEGGAPLAATAVQPRYDWAHLRGEKLEPPGPWRERARPLFDAVARFRRRRPDVRLAWSVLAALPPLRRWLLQRLTSGVHRARHAARRGAASWDDTRAVLKARWHRERQEATKTTQDLILHAREAAGRNQLPRMGCVPW